MASRTTRSKTKEAGRPPTPPPPDRPRRKAPSKKQLSPAKPATTAKTPLKQTAPAAEDSDEDEHNAQNSTAKEPLAAPHATTAPPAVPIPSTPVQSARSSPSPPPPPPPPAGTPSTRRQSPQPRAPPPPTLPAGTETAQPRGAPPRLDLAKASRPRGQAGRPRPLARGANAPEDAGDRDPFDIGGRTRGLDGFFAGLRRAAPRRVSPEVELELDAEQEYDQIRKEVEAEMGGDEDEDEYKIRDRTAMGYVDPDDEESDEDALQLHHYDDSPPMRPRGDAADSRSRSASVDRGRRSRAHSADARSTRPPRHSGSPSPSNNARSPRHSLSPARSPRHSPSLSRSEKELLQSPRLDQRSSLPPSSPPADTLESDLDDSDDDYGKKKAEEKRLKERRAEQRAKRGCAPETSDSETDDREDLEELIAEVEAHGLSDSEGGKKKKNRTKSKAKGKGVGDGAAVSDVEELPASKEKKKKKGKGRDTAGEDGMAVGEQRRKGKAKAKDTSGTDGAAAPAPKKRTRAKGKAAAAVPTPSTSVLDFEGANSDSDEQDDEPGSKAGPVPKYIQDRLFAEHAAFEEKVVALAKECGKSPEALHKLLGGLVPKVRKTSMWNMWQQHRAVDKPYGTSGMSLEAYRKDTRDSFLSVIGGVDPLDRQAVEERIPWLVKWHTDLNAQAAQNWRDNGKLKGKIMQILGPIVKQTRIIHETFGVHIWGQCVDPQGAASFLFGGTDDWNTIQQRMKTPLNQQLKDWEHLFYVEEAKRRGVAIESNESYLLRGMVQPKMTDDARDAKRHLFSYIMASQLFKHVLNAGNTTPENATNFKMTWNDKFCDVAYKNKCRVINWPRVLENNDQVIGRRFNLKKITLADLNTFMPTLERSQQADADNMEEDGAEAIALVPWDADEIDLPLADQRDVPVVVNVAGHALRKVKHSSAYNDDVTKEQKKKEKARKKREKSPRRRERSPPPVPPSPLLQYSPPPRPYSPPPGPPSPPRYYDPPAPPAAPASPTRRAEFSWSRGYQEHRPAPPRARHPPAAPPRASSSRASQVEYDESHYQEYMPPAPPRSSNPGPPRLRSDAPPAVPRTSRPPPSLRPPRPPSPARRTLVRRHEEDAAEGVSRKKQKQEEDGSKRRRTEDAMKLLQEEEEETGHPSLLKMRFNIKDQPTRFFYAKGFSTTRKSTRADLFTIWMDTAGHAQRLPANMTPILAREEDQAIYMEEIHRYALFDYTTG